MTCCPGDYCVESSAPMPWRRLAAGLFVAAQTMLLGMTINLVSPEDRSVRLALQWGMAIASVGVVGMLAGPLPGELWRAMKRGRLTLELLYVLSLIGAAGISIHSMITGHGPVYFDVIAVVSIVQAAGRVITQVTRNSAAAELHKLAGADALATKIHADGTRAQIPAAQVRVGDRIAVPAGGQILVDGVIESGQSLVRQTALTGEWMAIARRPGDPVLAGSIAEDGMLVIVATAHGTDREIDRMVQLIGTARQVPMHVQRQVDRWMQWFVPAVLLIAMGAGAVWWQRSGADAAIETVMSILLVACPCGVGLATPLSAWQTMGSLARRGLIVRGGDVLERLAQVRCVIFDKTGTLSLPAMKLQQVQWLEDSATVAMRQSIGGAERLMRMLAGIARQSNHPISRAMDLQAGELGGNSRMPLRELSTGATLRPEMAEMADELHRLPVGGLEARFGSIRLTMLRDDPKDQENAAKHVNVANPANSAMGSCLQDQCTALESSLDPDGSHDAAQANSRMETHRIDESQGLGVSVLIGGIRVAKLIFAEPLRDSAHPAVAQLVAMGLPVCLMTGDTPEAARQLAMGLPADSVRIMAQLSARQKHEAAGAYAASYCGRALFVGDGINDASAMARAHASIALADGAAITLDTAMATLHGGDLRTIVRAIQWSRLSMRHVRQNLIFSLLYNLLGIGLAACGWLHPVVAAVLMSVSSATVSAWSMRLGRRLKEREDIDQRIAYSENNAAEISGTGPIYSDAQSAAQSGMNPRAGMNTRTSPVVSDSGPRHLQSDPQPVASDVNNWTRPVNQNLQSDPQPVASDVNNWTRPVNQNNQMCPLFQRMREILLHGLGWMLQGIILLLMIRPGIGLGTALMGICLATGAMAGLADRRMSRAMRMIWLMLAWGGVGMVIGWWADVDWATGADAAVIPACCRLILQSGGSLASSGELNLPMIGWMYAGMLLLGVPAMYLPRKDDPRFSWRQWCCTGPLVVGVPAMCLGMWLGSQLAIGLMTGNLVTDPLIHWALMMLGMSAGMSLCHVRELLGITRGSSPDLVREVRQPTA